MTDAFGDKALSSWTPSGIQSTLAGIERTFQNCNQELAALQMGDCDYVFQAAAITEMTENMGYLQTYASSAPGYVYETLDQPLFENFKNNATETLSQIVLDDLETENTIGMEEHFAVSGKGTVYNSKRVKTSLKFEDFLGLPAVEAEEGMPVLENVETVNEFAFLFRTDYDKMGQEDIETCIEAYLTAGEFNHMAYHPVKDFLSGLLDITIVKPLIESVTGYDMITGERLTEAEKNMKLMGACVDLFTFGQGMVAMKGAGLAGKQLCKALGKELVVDFFANTAAYTMNYGCGELGVPAEITWLLSVATGCTVATAGNKFLFKDLNGNVTEYTLEEVQEKLTKDLPDGNLVKGVPGDVKVKGVPENNLMAKPKEGRREEDRCTSYADLMNPEEAERYLKFLENGSTAGLTPEELLGIQKLDEWAALNGVDYDEILALRKLEGGGGSDFIVEVELSRNKYPESAKHIQDAIADGQPEVLTIDRGGAKERRKASLKGVDTIPGLDRDEYPPAMSLEGGRDASVRHIGQSDNRGSGSSLSHQLREFPDGTKYRIVIIGDE